MNEAEINKLADSAIDLAERYSAIQAEIQDVRAAVYALRDAALRVHPAEPVAGHVAEGLTDEAIDALWRKWVGVGRANYSFARAAIAADRAGREQAPESILVKLRYIKRVLESMHPTPKDRADAAWACREMIESEWNAGRAQGDGALLDWLEKHRVSLIPEFEGPWDAAVYGDDGEPKWTASDKTPRDAIRAAMKAESAE